MKITEAFTGKTLVITGGRTSFITEKIEIGSNVWIGANTIILRGTIIGDNTVIGAGCILKGKFDGNCVITQKRNTSIKALKADS